MLKNKEMGNVRSISGKGTENIPSNVVFHGLSDAIARHLEVYLDAHEGNLPVGQLYECVLGELERPLISLVLERLRGNQIKTADVLGINRNTLRKKIRKYNIVVRRRSKNAQRAAVAA